MTPQRGDLVHRGARLAGAIADAVFVVDSDEHERRNATGVGPVTSLEPLYRQLDRLALEPDLFFDGRVLKPAGRIEAVEIRSWHRIQAAFDRALIFAPVAPVHVVAQIDMANLDELALHASALGVGVKVAAGPIVEELVPATAPTGIFDAATWSFYERAYVAWLREFARSRATPHDDRGRSAA